MNYATIEEAWAKPKGTLNKFPISSVKHPLVAKGEMADEDPKDQSHPPVDPDEVDIKTMTGLRRTLRRLFEERGSFGIDLVLPAGYVEEQARKQASLSLESFVDIEEIAKWMLMAAVVYIIFDLAK
jgi:hypothetical protein